MRPQDLDASAMQAVDDLGWNDMGLQTPSVPTDRDTVAMTKGPKVAFTVRLDAERHRRLRSASAVTGSPAQHLVTQALDAFLRALPKVDALAATRPPAKSQR